MMRFSVFVLLMLSAHHSYSCGLEVTPVGQNANNLSIVIPQAEVRHIANIRESCPETDGYIVSISSQNQSKLKSDLGIGYSYQVSYAGGNPVDLSSPYDKIYMAPSDGSTKSLSVVLPSRRQARQGTYNDTLTVSISAR